MKLLPAILLALSFSAHAESFFRMEAGLGGSFSKDQGDGIWYQQGVPHHEQMATPAYLLGFTGDLTENLRWHADYVYFGEYSASCLCVTDQQYNTNTHTASVPGYIPFNGHGHTQGVAMTLDYGRTWRGVRYSAEAGPWVYWATWHVTHDDPAQPGAYSLNHVTVPQLGAVIGVRAEYGNNSLSYRLYTGSRKGNPYPAMAQYTHMLMFVHKF
jgi:hypothetical protein